MEKSKHEHHEGDAHDHTEHHRIMIRDFRRRFYVTIILTVPVLALSPLIQSFLGFSFTFPGADPLVFALATGKRAQREEPRHDDSDCGRNYGGLPL